MSIATSNLSSLLNASGIERWNYLWDSQSLYSYQYLINGQDTCLDFINLILAAFECMLRTVYEDTFECRLCAMHEYTIERERENILHNHSLSSFSSQFSSYLQFMAWFVFIQILEQIDDESLVPKWKLKEKKNSTNSMNNFETSPSTKTKWSYQLLCSVDSINRCFKF